MNIQENKFYLTSQENFGFEEPRECQFIKMLIGDKRKDYLLIKVDPSLKSSAFSKKVKNYQQVIIASRHVGESLFNIKKLPISVYICGIINEKIMIEGKLETEDIENAAWGEIYETYEDAKKASDDFLKWNKIEPGKTN